MAVEKSPSIHIAIVDGANYEPDGFAFERSQWEALGARVSVHACKSEAELLTAAADAEVAVYMGLYTPFTAAVLGALPRCGLIARYGIGMDSVDITAATARGILVANAAEYCVPEVADHATALILALARRVVFLDRHVRGGGWGGALEVSGPVPRLSTLTLGLVGLGRIARTLAENLRPMMGRIIASDPFVSQAQADELGVQLVSLEELLAEADFVSVHTPLTDQTRSLIGANEFPRMKPTGYIVNTSRGGVIDEEALIDALRTKRIAGAGLDVVTVEPLSEASPLRILDNVILTPHFAAYSEQSLEDLRSSVVQTVSDYVQGYWPAYVMNPDVKPPRTLQRQV